MTRPQWVKEFTQEIKVIIHDEVKKAISDQLAAFRETVEKMDVENKRLKKENDALKSSQKRLETRVLSLEAKSLRSNIEISGIPVSDDEDLVKMLSAIGKKVNYSLTAGHILTTYRAGTKKQVGDRVYEPKIIAQLRNCQIQDEFLSKVREFWKAKGWKVMASDLVANADDIPISVGRQLSAEQRFLFSRAKALAKEKNYKFTWISRSGKLMIRKSENDNPLYINNIDDLYKIK